MIKNTFQFKTFLVLDPQLHIYYISTLTDIAAIFVRFKSKFAESIALEVRTGLPTLADLTTTVKVSFKTMLTAHSAMVIRTGVRAASRVSFAPTNKDA